LENDRPAIVAAVHALAGVEIRPVSDSAAQIFADQRNRFFGEHIAERMAALVDGTLAEGQREVGVVHGGVRLDGVRQGVDAAVGRHLRWTRHAQQWIDQRDPRPQVIAQDADLDFLLGVGEHGCRGHFGAGARRGRQTKQRHDRAGNLVVAGVIERFPAVGENDGGDLGEVHVAAAAESEHGVGAKLAAQRDRLLGGARGRLRLAAGKYFDDDAGLTERHMHGFDDAGLDEHRVGDEEDAAGAETAGDLTELSGSLSAED
jgi:hypothetical protein